MQGAKLKKRFGLLGATMIGVGAIVETTLFIMIGTAAGMAGPGVIITFVIGAIVNYFAALNYSELASAIHVTGGGYAFTKEAIGKFPAFITGWFMWLGTMFYCALCALGVAYGVRYFFPILDTSVIAVVMVLVFMIANVKRTKKIETVLEALIFSVIGMLVLFITLGLLHGPQPDAFTNIAPHGWPTIFSTSGYIFICFIGFSVVSTVSEEVKDPGKNVPRAILLSLTIGTIIYVLTAYVAVGIVSYDELGMSATPLSDVAKKIPTLGSIGGDLMGIAMIFASLAGLNSAMLAATRVMYALGRDGYFPSALSRIHKKLKTPYLTVIICSSMIAIFTAVGIADFVGYAADFGYLIGFALVNYSVILFRKKHPMIERPFKTPLYPLFPILGLASTLILFLILPTLHPEALALGSILAIIGLLAYYVSMLGYMRLRIAFGGIAIAVGFVVSVTALSMCCGFVPTAVSPSLSSGMLFMGIVQIIAGVLNTIVRTSIDEESEKTMKILATVAGILQIAIGALAVIFVCVLYCNLFEIQSVLGILGKNVLMYALLLFLFAIVSITSGSFLIHERSE
jgi:APA family basic amino acid/polyamine antiporter